MFQWSIHTHANSAPHSHLKLIWPLPDLIPPGPGELSKLTLGVIRLLARSFCRPCVRSSVRFFFSYVCSCFGAWVGGGGLGLQLGVLYMSFMFFTKQFQAARVKEAIQNMEASKRDDVSQTLKPVPKGEEKVSVHDLCLCVHDFCVCDSMALVGLCP